MNLDQFAHRIREIGVGVEENVGEVMIRTAVVVNQVVVSATPVDTGRARANWQVSIGSSPLGQLSSGDRSPGGASTIARNNATIQARRAGDIYLGNNVHYIGRLNQGSSAQAPAGFVEQAVDAAVRAVRRSRVVR